jgi:hypothetical protein
MPSAELEPTIPASERPQTYAIDRTATGIGLSYTVVRLNYILTGLFIRFRELVIRGVSITTQLNVGSEICKTGWSPVTRCSYRIRSVSVYNTDVSK